MHEIVEANHFFCIITLGISSCSYFQFYCLFYLAYYTLNFHLPVHASLYKNTLYKNIENEIYQKVKNVLRIRSSCIFANFCFFFKNNIALSSWDYYVPFVTLSIVLNELIDEMGSAVVQVVLGIFCILY